MLECGHYVIWRSILIMLKRAADVSYLSVTVGQ